MSYGPSTSSCYFAYQVLPVERAERLESRVERTALSHLEASFEESLVTSGQNTNNIGDEKVVI